MAEALKDIFNVLFYKHLASEISVIEPDFDSSKFVKQVLSGLDELSLNERMRKTSIVLNECMPGNFKKSITTFYKVIPKLHRNYTTLVFPDFVGLYGHNDFELSMDALKYFTQYGSSEFAIREFLKRDLKRTIKVLERWAEDKNQHIRRLASEGCRPRLPWSFKMDEVIKNPSLTKNILEKLNKDKELYVRKSVANHLNDISKDNPDYLIQTVKNWSREDPYTAWIIKHACRTLIKKGNREIITFLNFEKFPQVTVSKFKFNKKRLLLGETLQFDFEIRSEKKKLQRLVIDYVVHYQKKNGKTSPKVFKLKVVTIHPDERIQLSKRHVFKDYTTRKHFQGVHCIELKINGQNLDKKTFELFL